MRKQTLKKGGFKWTRNGYINKKLRSVKFDIDSRCKRKFYDLSDMCTETNLYGNIAKSIRVNTNTPYFYYVNPNKREFIYEGTYWVDAEFEKKLTTKFTNFPYYFLVTKKNKNLFDYNNKQTKEREVTYGIPCDMFGLIPNDVDFKELLENVSHEVSKEWILLSQYNTETSS